jgi:hypothetical protein
VAARELPKGALVEWQVTRHTGEASWPVIPRVRAQKTTGDESSDDDDDKDETARVQVASTRGRHASMFHFFIPVLIIAHLCARLGKAKQQLILWRRFLFDTHVSRLVAPYCRIGMISFNFSSRLADPDEMSKAALVFEFKDDLAASFSARLFYDCRLPAWKGAIDSSCSLTDNARANGTMTFRKRSGSCSSNLE